MAGAGGLDIRLEGLFGAVTSPKPECLSCPACGSALSSLLREGRLGCPRCASSFRPAIRRLLSARDEARSRWRPNPGRAPAVEAWPAPIRSRDSSAIASLPFAFPAFSAFGAPGPEDDVVLLTAARASRAIEGLPFPGVGAPSRGAGALRFLEGLPGWSFLAPAELEAGRRRALVELAFLPPSFAADSRSRLALSEELPLYALEGETDHFRAIARLPGLQAKAAAGLALGLAEAAGRARAAAGSPPFALDEEFGWLCASVEELGPGLTLSAFLHLPALCLAGLQDRLFRALMAEGLQLRGLYSDAEASTGSVFELAAGGAAGDGPAEIAEALERGALKAAAAERRTRAEIARRDPEAILDVAGRALGILANARRVGLEEAASLISALRLASLAGMLEGLGPGRLGSLLGLLGPGLLEAASGGEGGGASPGGGWEAARSRFLRGEVARAELAHEEDRCSRD